MTKDKSKCEKVIHNIRFYDLEPKAIHCMVYDESSKSLALSRSDGSVEIWNCLKRPFKQYVIHGEAGSSADALAWSNNRLFSGSFDGFVTEYDLTSLQPKSYTAVTGGAVWSIALSPDGTKLAAGTEEGIVCLFNVRYEIQYINMLNRQEGRVMSLAWHKDGQFLVTGSVDYVILWSLDKGQQTRFHVGRSSREKESIVWCVALLDDMTIVTGDSRGMCCFWDGRFGTLLDGIQTHKADILALEIAADQSSVITAGVDPAIVQIDKVETRAKQGRNKMWVKSVHRHIHSHDVRAMALTLTGRLFSGGVDTVLAQSYFPPKTAIKYPAMPHRGFISVARNAHCILLSYADRLELWRLGQSQDKVEGGVTGSFMSITQNRIKLLELQAKKDHQITWCAISPSAKYISYIISGNLKIFLFIHPQNGVEASVKKLQNLSHEIEPTKQLLWITDMYLVVLTQQGSIQILEVNETEVTIVKTFTIPKERNIYLMTASDDGSYLAVADNKNVTIFNLKTDSKKELPKKKCQPTAFRIKEDLIVVVYSDLSIIEYNLTKKEYTPFCRHLMTSMPVDWHKRNLSIQHIAFDPQNSDIIYFHDAYSLIVMNKSKDCVENSTPEKQIHKIAKLDNSFDTSSNSSVQSSCKTGTFTIIDRGNILVYFSELQGSNVISVEVNPITLEDKLPAALKIKKFGGV